MVEILAPSGNMDALTAAVRSGADAVYIGMGDFNARRNAENFDENFCDAVRYCRINGVKVYLTLNTLIYDFEREKALSVALAAANAGVNGIITADLGLTAKIHEMLPDMPLHASTQMTVHTADALYILKEMGFTRVVPSRELFGCELEKICQTAKELSMETEVFVHGALCMSMSGQCLMSAFLGGRSGNRGLCAGTCRLPFKTDGGNGYALSLKDLSLVKRISELENMGVTSLKIEGRMKPPEYVAAAVAACREAVDCGSVSEQSLKDLEEIFSREGFSDGYFEGKTGKEMFGVRTSDALQLTRAAEKRVHELYRTERNRITTALDFYCHIGENSRLTVTDGAHSVTVSGLPPEVAKNTPMDEKGIAERLKKTGNTPYIADKITVDCGEGIILAAAEINRMRRECFEMLSEKRGIFTPPEIKAHHPTPEKIRTAVPKIIARFNRADALPSDLSGLAAVVVPAENLNKRIPDIKVIAELPRGMSDTALIERALNNAEKFADGVLCNNLAAVKLCIARGLTVYVGNFMNILNSDSLSVLEKFGVKGALLSAEIRLEDARKIGTELPIGIIAYGKIPLMLTRNCPIKSGNGCKACKHFITDRKGLDFPVYCRAGYSEIYNPRPIMLSDRINELTGLDFIMLYFTDEDSQTAAKIITAYKNGTKCDGEYTRGLYYKGVN